ncbi:hypothetical protein FF011L_12080 [Roseimaritima multifibrata]|uniref:Uncharacterized protein n=1 Tax=Roseimaritima multifibrata TaxID=1930274 RepID=A0A517MC68_9BACT|nr:ATP-binding protein [Roseimaritima multifibrata]QDS92465.1 hypothetical protein FF011L_12080 [Roseimaritima multifibrata]
MADWIENHKIAWPAIVAVVSFFGGGFFRFLYERYFSERAVPTEKLLKRFAGNRLGSYGRRRLRNESLQALAGWHAELVPPAIGHKLRAWPETEFSVVEKDFSDGVTASRCPRLEDEEPSYRPLYISATSAAESLADSRSVVQSVIGQIKLVADNQEGSAALIKYRVADDRRPARLWVSAPQLQVTSTHQIYSLSQDLAKEVRRWIPSVSIVVEVYMSDDIQLDFEKAAESNSATIVKQLLGEDVFDDAFLRQASNSSEAYAIARTFAFYMLKQGAILDVAEPSMSYPVTDDILDERFKTHFANGVLTPGKWECVSIFGPPGSGKTDLARKCAAYLVSEHKSLIVALSTEGSLAALDFLTRGQNEEEARQALSSAVKRFVPTERSEDASWVKGCLDAFVRCSQVSPDRLVFLIDDLLPRPNLKEIITGITSNDSARKPKLILIGRPRLDFLPRPNSVYVECEHWGRGDATKMLRSWVEEGLKTHAAKALKAGWAAKRKAFSIYHLRVLVQYVDRPDLAPSTFMREELQRMTAPLTEHFVGLSRPPEQTLSDIRTMIESAIPSSEILEALDDHKPVDIVSLLGQLSWNSKYHEVAWSSGRTSGDLQALMNRDRVLSWSGKKIRDVEEADSFIRTCVEAGIFRQVRGEGGAHWIDNFIADGFAANYIGSDMLEGSYEIGDLTIADMVEKLHQRNSLDILPFALRSNQLMRVIRAVVLKKPHLADAVNSLLTDETVSAWLKEEPRLADDLTGALLAMASEIDLIQIGPLGVAFSEMTAISENAASLAKERLGKSDPGGMLALSGVAAESDSISGFFEQADSLGVDKTDSTEIAFWSAHKSRTPDFRKRIIQLIEGGTSMGEINRLWGRWCSSCEGPELANELYALLEGGVKDTSALSELVDQTCNAIADRSRGKRILDRAGFVAAIQHLHSQNEIDVAEVAVGWLGYFWNSGVCSRADRWSLDKVGSVAIQLDSQMPAKVSEVFSKLRAGEAVSLPSSSQLKQIGADTSTCPEIVSDRLPKRFSYTYELRPGWLMCVDKGETRYVDLTNELNKLKFQWRIEMIVQ